ncbi:hypothetical protein HK104_011478 [Borealophlyctis nickersoniae]|nr:hypothetical protein HK104_011478 [Borealophlyctis nickersoniae]
MQQQQQQSSSPSLLPSPTSTPPPPGFIARSPSPPKASSGEPGITREIEREEAQAQALAAHVAAAAAAAGTAAGQPLTAGQGPSDNELVDYFMLTQSSQQRAWRMMGGVGPLRPCLVDKSRMANVGGGVPKSKKRATFREVNIRKRGRLWVWSGGWARKWWAMREYNASSGGSLLLDELKGEARFLRGNLDSLREKVDSKGGGFVIVAYTHSPDEYDRTSIQVEPVSKDDLVDLLTYRAQIQATTNALYRMRQHAIDQHRRQQREAELQLQLQQQKLAAYQYYQRCSMAAAAAATAAAQATASRYPSWDQMASPSVAPAHPDYVVANPYHSYIHDASVNQGYMMMHEPPALSMGAGSPTWGSPMPIMYY